jgi:two-component system phosphate regulon sensor histidine kinase PhoR
VGDQLPGTPDGTEMAYAQAKRYGVDLARVYKQERAKRQELEIANQKLRAVWATAPNGLAVLDEQMCVVEANPRFEALVEQSGECTGSHLADLLPSDRLAAALAAAAREGVPFTDIEVTLARPDNRTLQVTGAPLAAGAQRGWVISLFDLTERKRLEGLKEEFIDIAAHELRTPLAIILGFASVLNDDLSDLRDPDTLAPIEAIVGAANRLKTIINELVEFAATRTRSSSQAVDQFDLWNLVEQSVGTLSHQARDAGVRVIVESAGRPLMVSGDRMMIAQALTHLMENGIKYNRPDGLLYVRAFEDQGQMVLEIEDTGVGIPAAELDTIFDLFYQVEEHMTRARGGLGMGLPIARRAIELHGGRIEVSSAVGKGSCFRVILPPVSQHPSVVPQTWLDSAHRQTLSYGRDLARAFVMQRVLSKRLRRVAETSQQLAALLEQGRTAEALSLAQKVARDALVRSDHRTESGH